MEDAGIERGELRVGAHVLVQLGAELVTDAEQALLECVKNAYDADAPGCRVEIDTRFTGELLDRRAAGEAVRFSQSVENVTVTVEDAAGAPVDPARCAPDELVTRRIAYEGRVVIEDRGTGISHEGLERSWLVVSRSVKRVADGPKRRTPLGRTPLGDKGLGRLGTMKLGDLLLVETATAPGAELSYAWFRWADCESAATVDEVPVVLGRKPNADGFKGTRVSVLGLREVAEWRRPKRLDELTRSMARLVSPFEAAAAFPVSLVLDGGEQSLGMVTDELLNQAVADFSFDWRRDDEGGLALYAVARLSRRIFTSERTTKLKERTGQVFADGGKAFADHLAAHRRMRGYDSARTDHTGRWFVEVSQRVPGSKVLDRDALRCEPGPFSGAFYYYFFVGETDGDDGGAVAGARAGLRIVRDLAGIAILRDGFQVRNRGDWLDLSAGMTSGSTYSMRPENTIGFFALSGAENWRLREKSDREGFVDDASYRAFLKIAQFCRDFANRALVSSRRVLDDYWKDVQGPPAMDAAQASRSLGEAGHAARRIQGLGDELGTLLADDVGDGIAGDPTSAARRAQAMALVAQVVSVARGAVGELGPDALVQVIDREVSETRARNVALVESAAVGQAARGLVHELRTHLAEIRFRAGAIERDRAGGALAENLALIRRSCAAIGSAAAQIDPMLPRSRAVKDRFDLLDFVAEYGAQRSEWLSRSDIAFSAAGRGTRVRMNRARLLQVVDNLVRNSVFWLERDVAAGRAIAIDVGERGFILSDNGPGVDPLVEDTLFELFITMRSLEDGGQGLGLFISAELLALDGCSISLMSDRNSEGRRYRFAVDLSAVVEA